MNDISDTLREEGINAVRARHDGAKRWKAGGSEDSVDPKAVGVPPFSEEALALRFAEQHADGPPLCRSVG